MLRRYWLALGLGSVLLTGATFQAVDAWRFRVECDDLGRQIAKNQYREAFARASQLLEQRPNEGELLYQLGICEWALGRPADAVRRWSQVPSSSSFAGQAAVQRARWELQSHRFAPAEELMAKALADRGPHAIEAMETLVNLFKIEGRFDEARRLVREFRERYPNRIGLLRELAQLGSINPHKLDLVRGALETASTSAADDDRVWLGRANMATRVGQLDEAETWLKRCLAKRPVDAAVWHAALNLALARENVDDAWEALAHLRGTSMEPAEQLQLRAWFAAHAGDPSAERKALVELVALEVSNLKGLERLAELELRAGRAEEAAKLRERKATLDRAKALYEILLFQPNASAQAVQLARLADTLSRPLEARILWGMVAEQHPADGTAKAALARLDSASKPESPNPHGIEVLLAERQRLSTPLHKKAVDAQSREAEPLFVDDAERAGLGFTFDNGIEPFHHLPETMSGGLGLLDYDGDGWLDVYCVQGGAFLPGTEKATGGDRLFHNRGDGTFEDATEHSGIATLSQGYGHGVAVGDFDNDGHPDLFVTRWRSYALYHNTGHGTFEEVTQQAGLDGDRDWPTSAAFADLDGDGDLDLFVCHYLVWDVDNPKLCWDPKKNSHVFCGPPRFASRPDHLFRNDGGHFVDITAEAGIVDTHGQGLGVVACDYDGDGRVDLFVANDQSASFLYHNLGGMRFEEIGETSGVASSSEGTFQASMGVACGDPDGDGLPDLAVTNFYNEGTTLYHNLGQAVFSDHSAAVGLRIATRYMLGFGTSFLDFDADGQLDLAATNGHVDDFRPREPYMMPAQLLAGRPGGKFVDVSARAGSPWQVPRLGRGLAAGDLDNDGRVDLLILGQNQPLAYFHNKTESGHWMMLRLEGTASNRDAVGARVTVTAKGRRQTAWRFGGGSYQSASDTRLHFGLGHASEVELVEILWPSGQVERFEGPLVADAGYLLREGTAMAQPLPGYDRHR